MSLKQALTFDEVARLINRSRNTEILINEKREQGGVTLYPAKDMIRGRVFPFEIVYLPSSANNDALKFALSRKPKTGEKIEIVFPLSFAASKATVIERAKRAHIEVDPNANLFSVQDYLFAFVSGELQGYQDALAAQKPQHFSAPRVETPSGRARKNPNPLENFLVDQQDSQTQNGAIAILLAEPGQGKTYQSRHLVASSCGQRHAQIPIFVDSSQWQALAVEDLQSLWKTLVNSFRHYNSTIGWLDGCEDQFLKTTLKADTFCVVFDGFDEYILRNKGKVDAKEVLESLFGLVEETGTRMIITSRTSFWVDWIPESIFDDRPNLFIYELKPFNVNEAHNYFKSRLNSESLVNRATGTYSKLRAANEDLVGRGFALSLIADLFESESEVGEYRHEDAKPLWWIVTALCQREQVRQKLPLDAKSQLEVLKTFGFLTCSGFVADDSTLEDCIKSHASDLDNATIKECLKKFSSHPILSRRDGHWAFNQKQVAVMFLAKWFLGLDKDKKSQSYEEMVLDSDQQHDLAEMVVEMLPANFEEEHVAELKAILDCLQTQEVSQFGASLALLSTNHFHGKGSQKNERSAFFKSLFDNGAIKRLRFSGTVSGLDLRGVEFRDCEFVRVDFANCTFDRQTIFDSCKFFGTVTDPRCDNFAIAFRKNCRYDQSARECFEMIEIESGIKSYTEDTLRRDFEHLLNKFIAANRTSIKALKKSDLTRGPIIRSKFQKVIIDYFMSSILEEHQVSGTADPGINVRPSCMDAIRFFAANHVFTGEIKKGFEHLLKQLKLT
jgi:hypothetical protein